MTTSASKLLSRVGLGSVQFGTHYGISNREGQPDEAEVAAILARAVEVGVGYLDTAVSYADAEVLVGRHLPPGHRLRVVTKLPPIAGDTITARDTELARAAVAASLDRLRLARVYGLLIHDARDLAKEGWQRLVDVLNEARARGWTSHTGVSTYDESDLALVESRFRPDIVQLPINVLDRRLVHSGWLARLQEMGVEVHARSLFLQGILLMEPAALPSHFAPLTTVLADLRASWAAEKLTPLAGCLAGVLHNPDVDVAIVGVNCLREFDEISAAVAELAHVHAAFTPPPIDPFYLDPRQWPRAAQ